MEKKQRRIVQIVPARPDAWLVYEESISPREYGKERASIIALFDDGQVEYLEFDQDTKSFAVASETRNYVGVIHGDAFSTNDFERHFGRR